MFEIEKYYRRSESDWIGLAHPPTTTDIAPGCPSCRRPISDRYVFRYERALKTLELNLQERETMVRGSRALEKISIALNNIDLTQNKKLLFSFSEPLKRISNNFRDIQAYQRKTFTLSYSSLTRSGSLGDLKLHGRSPSLDNAFGRAISPLLRVYKLSVDIALARTPHRVAYEGAVTTLYR